ncbi:MAG: TraR/DksA family transcriptional regulator [Syntrophothermus sp.]|nr:conjugal transfer protein TraR [Ignavibacteriaceae bacterium]
MAKKITAAKKTSLKKTAKKLVKPKGTKTGKKASLRGVAKSSLVKVKPKVKKVLEKKKPVEVKKKISVAKDVKKVVKKINGGNGKTMAKKKVSADVEKHPKTVKHTKAEEPKAQVIAPVKAVNHIKGYGKKDLEHFRKIILDKRDEILEQLQSLRDQMLDPTTGEYINENSPYSLHMAEQGTDAMEREKTFLYAQRENKFLGYLEDALKRIDAGTYGICIECIDEPQYLCETCPLVPKPRLEAVPHSQLCLPIKQRQEKFKP